MSQRKKKKKLTEDQLSSLVQGSTVDERLPSNEPFEPIPAVIDFELTDKELLAKEMRQILLRKPQLRNKIARAIKSNDVKKQTEYERELSANDKRYYDYFDSLQKLTRKAEAKPLSSPATALVFTAPRKMSSPTDLQLAILAGKTQGLTGSRLWHFVDDQKPTALPKWRNPAFQWPGTFAAAYDTGTPTARKDWRKRLNNLANKTLGNKHSRQVS